MYTYFALHVCQEREFSNILQTSFCLPFSILSLDLFISWYSQNTPNVCIKHQSINQTINPGNITSLLTVIMTQIDQSQYITSVGQKSQNVWKTIYFSVERQNIFYSNATSIGVPLLFTICKHNVLFDRSSLILPQWSSSQNKGRWLEPILAFLYRPFGFLTLIDI